MAAPTISRAQRRQARRSARTSALLSTLPQAQALSQLLRATQGTYAEDVGQAKSLAAITRASALSQVPALNVSLGNIASAQDAASAATAGRLASIGPGASDYAAAAAREAQASSSRLRGIQAGATTEMNTRAADAPVAAQYAIQGLTRRRDADVAKIQDQMVGLAQQRGLTASKTYEDLLNTAAQQGIQIRGQDLTFKAAKARNATTQRGQDLAHADRQAAANKKAKGKALTPGDTNKGIDKINYALSKISALEKTKLTSTQIREQLRNGVNVPASTDSKGNKIGAVKIDPIPNDYINAAYDLYAFGALSHTNRVRLIHGRGFRRQSIPKSWLAPAVARQTNPFGAGGAFSGKV